MIKEKIINLYNSKLNEHEMKIIEPIINDKKSFINFSNEKIKNKQNIAFIIGSIPKFSGGNTSILRLGTGLENNGKTVTYISFNNTSEKILQENAKYNLKDVKGEFKKIKDVKYDSYDIVIATSWISAYYAKKFRGYKMYFVQDYEPYFFKLNDRYLLAKKTYELGFHIISLGKWNIEQIKKHTNKSLKYDILTFPYEPKEYDYYKRDFHKYREKKKIKIAVYSKEDGKRIPNILQLLIYNANNELKKDNLEIEAYFFGFDKKKKLLIGKNLGMLSKKGLTKLYKESDFGMVASMTNISLVPYEMMATGLPIIEFEDGSFLDFFDKNDAILIDYNYYNFANELKENILNPKRLEIRDEKIQNKLKNLTWTKTIIEFIEIINNL